MLLLPRGDSEHLGELLAVVLQARDHIRTPLQLALAHPALHDERIKPRDEHPDARQHPGELLLGLHVRRVRAAHVAPLRERIPLVDVRAYIAYARLQVHVLV